MLFVDGKDGIRRSLALDGQLGDQRLYESSEAQSTAVVEVKVEIGQCRTWCRPSVSDQIFNDRGAGEISTIASSHRFTHHMIVFPLPAVSSQIDGNLSADMHLRSP